MPRFVATEVVGDANLVDIEDAQKLYALIAAGLEKDEKTEVSFRDVNQIITAFANAAIGQLYNEFTEEKIRKCLVLTEMDDLTRETLSRSVERSKLFYESPDRIQEIQKREMGDDDVC